MSKPFRLAVAAIVLDRENNCLLLRRSPSCGNFAGKWEWPGGKVEAGEDLAAALIREVEEETALKIEITEFAGATTFEMPTVRVALLCLEARAIGGSFKLSNEHDQFDWVPLANLNQWELVEHARSFMVEYACRKVTIAPNPNN